MGPEHGLLTPLKDWLPDWTCGKNRIFHGKWGEREDITAHHGGYKFITDLSAYFKFAEQWLFAYFDQMVLHVVIVTKWSTVRLKYADTIVLQI